MTDREREVREIVAKALDDKFLNDSANCVRMDLIHTAPAIAVRALLPLVERNDRALAALEACVQFASDGVFPWVSGKSYVRVRDAGLAELAAREAAKPKPRYYVGMSADGRIGVYEQFNPSAFALFSGHNSSKYAEAHAERLNAEVKP